MAFPCKKVRTLEERLRIIEEVEKNPTEKRIDIAKRLGLPPSTLNCIMAKKIEIRQQADKCGTAAKKRKTGKESTYSELENVLFSWYQQARASGIPIDGTILKEKSLKIAETMGIENFSASNGWISRFKQRHGLVFKKLAGESAAVDTNATDLWFQRLPELLEEYEPRDIYNADETGLFFNCLPDRTLALKGESCHGGKSAKERLTVLLCTNSDGSDKQVPIVIGKSAKPRCFKNVKKLPVKYYANSKAWMTSEIFRDILHALDKFFGAKGRKILLFIDNCAAHSPDTSSLKNVKVIFYPPNCTSVVQPLDLGVIKNFKQAYRKQLVQRALCLMDERKEVKMKIDILQAIHFIVSAWQQVTQFTIQNCFVKCGYGDRNEESDMSEVNRNDEDEDWTQLETGTAGVDFDAYVSVDQELATCGVLSVEEMCEEVASGSSMEEGQVDSDDNDEVDPKPVPSFQEALSAFETMRAFIYAHEIADRDQVNIINIEKLLFSLKSKGASKQMKISDFF